MCTMPLMCLDLYTGAKINGRGFLILKQTTLDSLNVSTGFKLQVTDIIEDLVCSSYFINHESTAIVYILFRKINKHLILGGHHHNSNSLRQVMQLYQ